MKKENVKFLIHSLIFTAVMLGIVIAVNNLYYTKVLANEVIFRKETDYQKYLKELPWKKLRYGFFGDSHASDDVISAKIPDSYNFGTSAQNYVKTYYRLRKILDRDSVILGTAIFEVDMHTFTTSPKETEMIDELYFYSKFIPITEIAQINSEAPPETWVKAHFASFGKGSDFFTLAALSDLTKIERGWTKAAGDFSVKTKDERNREAEAVYDRHFENRQRIGDKKMEYFLKCVDLAEHHKIKSVFIVYPVSEAYQIALFSHHIEKESYYRTIKEKIKGAKRGAPVFFDYYTLFNGHPEYFSDPDHLNEQGAEILTKQIQTDLQNYRK